MMNYLLDTCVLSEYTKKQPTQRVVDWVASNSEATLFLSALSIGEIVRGVELMPESHRKAALFAWLNKDLLSRFGERLLPIDADVMLIWGSLAARLEKSGHKLPFADSLIAATALNHNLVLVTRNEADYINSGVQMINPW